MSTRIREAATALAAAVARRIGPPRYKLWFDGRTRFGYDDGRLTVGVPNRHSGNKTPFSSPSKIFLLWRSSFTRS